MSERKTVPVAYVTKWARTRGILVVTDAEVDVDGYLDKGIWLLIPPSQWTEDKSEAEVRYRSDLMHAERLALKRHKALVDAINAPPKYTEDES